MLILYIILFNCFITEQRIQSYLHWLRPFASNQANRFAINLHRPPCAASEEAALRRKKKSNKSERVGLPTLDALTGFERPKEVYVLKAVTLSETDFP